MNFQKQNWVLTMKTGRTWEDAKNFEIKDKLNVAMLSVRCLDNNYHKREQVSQE
jgi:hypothetical protein